MLEGLRSEFPSATAWIQRLRLPSVARESVVWAFLSAAGAGFILGGIVGLLLFVLAPAIFPPTEPRPSWLTFPIITRTAAAIAIGAVAARSGGLATLALYVGYELVLTIAAFPGRQRSCAFSQAAVSNQLRLACDIPGLVVDRWPVWVALAAGALGSRWLLSTGGAGANRLLRGAGVFAVALTVATTSYGLLTIATLSFRQSYFDLIFTSIYVIGEVIAGLLAGLVLRRAPAAASVLVAVLILSSLAFALPMVINNRIPNMPLELLFLQWTGVIAPILGAVSVVVVRVLADRGDLRSGT